MNKYYHSLILLILIISITLNSYLLFVIIKIPNEKIIMQDDFIHVIQEIIYKIENKSTTKLQKENYQNQIIEIIKKYPK